MTDAYVKRLEDEKAALEQQIKALQAEVHAINNLIYRKKAEELAVTVGQVPNRKNMDRLFFETLILDVLRDSKDGLRTKEIHDSLRKKGYSANYNTVRSYIAKMRDWALIQKKTPTSYFWIVADTE